MEGSGGMVQGAAPVAEATENDLAFCWYGGVDLKEITHPFAFELSGNGAQKEVVFIKGVVYDNQPAEEPLAATAEDLTEPLTAGIVSNDTEGVAPATFDFEANATGGTEPYSISQPILSKWI